MPHRPSPLQVAAPPRLVIERLSDRLAARLAAQVESGSLAPGDRLPTEQQLALAHGVSRTVVREAVHQLKSRGLLVSRQGSGVYVSTGPRNHALSFDAAVLESIDAVVQVREVRRALEGETAALAASRATRLQVAALRRALTDATGNPHFGRLLEFLEQYLAEAMRVTRGHEARRLDFMEDVRAEHRAIVDAVAAHQPSIARRRALEHMQRGDRRLQLAGLIAPAAPPTSKRRAAGAKPAKA